ncbi:MAG: hypothetical protein ACI9MC_001073, partial [Kiritimatiellia bacterium]
MGVRRTGVGESGLGTGAVKLCLLSGEAVGEAIDRTLSTDGASNVTPACRPQAEPRAQMQWC